MTDENIRNSLVWDVLKAEGGVESRETERRRSKAHKGAFGKGEASLPDFKA